MAPVNVPAKSSKPTTWPTLDVASKWRVHLIGIGGCGMSGLAAMLLKRGAQVSGTDAVASLDLARLAERGAKVTTRQEGEDIPEQVDLVVVSAAIPDDHPERLAAERRGLKVIKYAELLGLLMSQYHGIAISGTHGKSTTTAWLTYALKQAGLDPNFVVGATVAQLGGGSGVGDGPYFVAEACEYDRSFLSLRPQQATILNIEEDHLDCYENLAAIQAAFADFAACVPTDGRIVLNGDDANCCALAQDLSTRVETFGIGEGLTWQATNLRVEDGCHAFDVQHDGQTLGRARLGIPGHHNVYNALAVIANAQACGVPWEKTVEALATFSGARRRFETRGTVNEIRILDDYAHHPTEIRATLQAVRERYMPQKLWCVFQPHQHSRTRFLLEDFARSFSAADEVVVPDIYFVRDSEREREKISASDLVEHITDQGGRARYVGAFDEIVELLAAQAQPNDVVMTMGAGNIWKVADELVQRLGGHLPS
jgi:UDP-N-acetylmuramate--alanine ligase